MYQRLCCYLCFSISIYNKILEGLYFHFRVSVCLSVSMKKFPVKQMLQFWRHYCNMIAYHTDLDPVEMSDLGSKIEVIFTISIFLYISLLSFLLSILNWREKKDSTKNSKCHISKAFIFRSIFFIDSEAERCNIARNMNFKAFWRPFCGWYPTDQKESIKQYMYKLQCNFYLCSLKR